MADVKGKALHAAGHLLSILTPVPATSQGCVPEDLRLLEPCMAGSKGGNLHAAGWLLLISRLCACN